MVGTLVTDAAEVAEAVQAVLDNGTPGRQMGLRIPAGLPADISTVDRAIIRFEGSGIA